MNINDEERKAYAEVDYIIHNMNPLYLHKLPTKLVSFLDEVKDSDYKVVIDHEIPLHMNDLKEYTYDILNVLNVNYWCEDQEKKEELLDIMKKSGADYKLSTHMGSDITEEVVLEDETTKKKKWFF